MTYTESTQNCGNFRYFSKLQKSVNTVTTSVILNLKPSSDSNHVVEINPEYWPGFLFFSLGFFFLWDGWMGSRVGLLDQVELVTVWEAHLLFWARPPHSLGCRANGWTFPWSAFLTFKWKRVLLLPAWRCRDEQQFRNHTTLGVAAGGILHLLGLTCLLVKKHCEVRAHMEDLLQSSFNIFKYTVWVRQEKYFLNRLC